MDHTFIIVSWDNMWNWILDNYNNRDIQSVIFCQGNPILNKIINNGVISIYRSIHMIDYSKDRENFMFIEGKYYLNDGRFYKRKMNLLGIVLDDFEFDKVLDDSNRKILLNMAISIGTYSKVLYWTNTPFIKLDMRQIRQNSLEFYKRITKIGNHPYLGYFYNVIFKLDNNF